MLFLHYNSSFYCCKWTVDAWIVNLFRHICHVLKWVPNSFQERQLQRAMPCARSRLTRLLLPWNLTMMASWQGYWWVGARMSAQGKVRLVSVLCQLGADGLQWACFHLCLQPQWLSGRLAVVHQCPTRFLPFLLWTDDCIKYVLFCS